MLDSAFTRSGVTCGSPERVHYVVMDRLLFGAAQMQDAILAARLAWDGSNWYPSRYFPEQPPPPSPPPPYQRGGERIGKRGIPLRHTFMLLTTTPRVCTPPVKGVLTGLCPTLTQLPYV